MFDTLAQDIWLAWGIGLLIGFPLLMILFGEMLYRIEDTEKHEPSRSLLGNAQYFVFPSLVIYLLLTKVVGFESENVAVRATATIFWISLIYLVLSVFNMFWLKKSAGDGWQSRVPTLVLNIARLFLVAFGVAFVTSLIWGVDLGQMLAALGVGSIVLGLALQDTLGALFAGITLISARQFQVGDWLKTGDVVGRVITVNWHSVSLETFEGDLLVIPNSVLASNTFHNYSRPKRVHMERVIIQFCEEHPPNMVRQALLEAARNTPAVLEEPAPQVILRELADDAGAFEAQIYFSDYADIDAVRDAYLTRAWYAAKRYGIVFPFEDHQLFHFSSTEMNLGKDDTVTPDTLRQKLMELDVFGLSREQLNTLLVNAETARFGSGERVISPGTPVVTFKATVLKNKINAAPNTAEKNRVSKCNVQKPSPTDKGVKW